MPMLRVHPLKFHALPRRWRSARTTPTTHATTPSVAGPAHVGTALRRGRDGQCDSHRYSEFEARRSRRAAPFAVVGCRRHPLTLLSHGTQEFGAPDASLRSGDDAVACTRGKCRAASRARPFRRDALAHDRVLHPAQRAFPCVTPRASRRRIFCGIGTTAVLSPWMRLQTSSRTARARTALTPRRIPPLAARGTRRGSLRAGCYGRAVRAVRC